jgi:hypothetical protein
MVAGYVAKELASRSVKPGELAILSADSAVPYERHLFRRGFSRARTMKRVSASMFP